MIKKFKLFESRVESVDSGEEIIDYLIELEDNGEAIDIKKVSNGSITYNLGSHASGWWFDIIMKYLKLINHPLKYIDNLPLSERPTDVSFESQQLKKISEDLTRITILWDLSNGSIDQKFNILKKEIERIERTSKYRLIDIEGARMFTYKFSFSESPRAQTDLIFYKVT